MVGPGTGAAPFRGFLWERYVASKTSAMAQTIFYYGCRHPDNDRLYKNEFDEIGKQDWVSIKNAFSRNGGKKVYVQQLVKEDCDLVWDILENRKGVFYVCGDAKNMATAVYATLVEVAMIKNGLDEEGGKEWVKRLKSGGRYLEDTWS